MGTCCGGKSRQDNDTNMLHKGSKVNSKSPPTIDPKFMQALPIKTVVKIQALFRGFLTRKKIKKIYGFEVTPGLLNRTTILVEMDPEKLDEQRRRVQQIREHLPEFVYGLYPDEDTDPGIIKQNRDMILLPDGAHYEG